MDIKFMYYDRFANIYTLDKDDYAPPERYLLTYRGDDIYIEHYEGYSKTDKNKTNKLECNVAYSEIDVENNLVNNIRFKVFGDDFSWQTAEMTRWTIPARKFDEYWNRFIET